MNSRTLGAPSASDTPKSSGAEKHRPPEESPHYGPGGPAQGDHGGKNWVASGKLTIGKWWFNGI